MIKKYITSVIVLILLATLTPNTTGADQDQITFQWKPLPVNQSEKTNLQYSYEKTRTLSANKKSDNGSGNNKKEKKDQQKFTGEAVSIWTKTPLAHKNGQIRKMNVKYGKCSSTSALKKDGDVKRKRQAPPVSQKTYIITRNDDDSLDFSTPDGYTPSSYEQDVLQKQWKKSGAQTGLCKILEGNSYAVGETIKMPFSVLQELMLGEPDIPDVIKTLDAKLEKISEENGQKKAHFLVKAQQDRKNDQVNVSFEGTMNVSVNTCRITNLDLTMQSLKSRSRQSKSTQYNYKQNYKLRLQIHRTYKNSDHHSSE